MSVDNVFLTPFSLSGRDDAWAVGDISYSETSVYK
jgi:hypothetical protein